MKKIACVSDLHLFCRRSNAESHIDSIQSVIANADIFIFNGDTFDFRWSRYDSIEETVDASIAWLKELVDHAPQCQFHFILGNHDCNELFVTALAALAQKHHNLAWHPYYITLGSLIFLHGDVANRKMHAQDLENYRKGWAHETQRGEMQNRLHDWVFRFNIHKIVAHALFPQARTIARLQHYLNDIDHGEGSAIQTVFFGHTHIRLNGIKRNGQSFHNGGAPMQGMDFEILHTKVD